MATVDSSGVTPTRLPGWLQAERDRWRAALGQNLNVADETPQGQLIGIFAEAETLIDEAILAVANGMSLETCAGRQLDDYGSLLGITRSAGTHTIAEIEIEGVPNGTVIPTDAEFVSGSGNFLSTRITVTPDRVAVRAEAPGEINTDSIKPVIDIPGATKFTVHNLQRGRPGESDGALRARYKGALGRSVNSSLEAVRTAVLAVERVTNCHVAENTTGADIPNYCGTTIFPDRSMFVAVATEYSAPTALVRDQIKEAIAAAIVRSKPIGVPVAHTSDYSGEVVDLYISIRTVHDVDKFPGNGTAELGDRLYGWLTGTWTGIADGGLDFGSAIDMARLEAVAYSIPGHKISHLTVSDKFSGPRIISSSIAMSASDIVSLDGTDGVELRIGTILTDPIDISGLSTLDDIAAEFESALNAHIDITGAAVSYDSTAQTMTFAFDLIADPKVSLVAGLVITPDPVAAALGMDNPFGMVDLTPAAACRLYRIERDDVAVIVD